MSGLFYLFLIFFFFGKMSKNLAAVRARHCPMFHPVLLYSEIFRLAAGECEDNFVFFFRQKLNQSRAALTAHHELLVHEEEREAKGKILKKTQQQQKKTRSSFGSEADGARMQGYRRLIGG